MDGAAGLGTYFVIAPPVPAPYLAAVPPLSDNVLELLDQSRLSPRQRRHVQQALADRQNLLRAARTAYEAAHGVRIAPELQHVS